MPTGGEHFWQNRTFVASKHLRCTNVPRAVIQKVGPEYIHHIPYLESRSPATIYAGRFQRNEEEASEAVSHGLMVCDSFGSRQTLFELFNAAPWTVPRRLKS